MYFIVSGAVQISQHLDGLLLNEKPVSCVSILNLILSQIYIFQFVYLFAMIYVDEFIDPNEGEWKLFSQN